jgi:hypothetical protein
MDGTRDHHTKCQKDKYHVFSHMWNLEEKKGHESKKELVVIWKRWRVRQGNRTNITKIHYTHVWKYHVETHYFVQLTYANKNGNKKKLDDDRLHFEKNTSQQKKFPH